MRKCEMTPRLFHDNYSFSVSCFAFLKCLPTPTLPTSREGVVNRYVNVMLFFLFVSPAGSASPYS